MTRMHFNKNNNKKRPFSNPRWQFECPASKVIVNYGGNDRYYNITNEMVVSTYSNLHWGGAVLESQNPKCQDLLKFQFSGGDVLEPNSRTGVFWAIWSEISGSLACLCITDSLSHTTYVETNELWHGTYFVDLSFFFQDEEIFIQLDELDKITHAWIGFNYSLTQAQKKL